MTAQPEDPWRLFDEREECLKGLVKDGVTQGWSNLH